jgi:flagellar biosynthetic protein FliR
MTILVKDFVIILLIFLRILSAFVAAPVFGDQSIPTVVKIFFSFFIAYMIFLVMDKSLINVNIELWWLFTNGIKEIVTGLVIGFSLNLVFYGLSFAGSLMGFDMGLNMGQYFNPSDQTETNLLGQAIYLVAILVFFVIDGHHYLIRELAYSFKVVPLGKFIVNKSVLDLLILYSANVFVIAVKIAAPILISFFLVNIGEGITARVIPQMQIFFVTQPLKLGLGFLMLVASAPLLVYTIKNLLKSFEDNLYSLVKAMGA